MNQILILLLVGVVTCHAESNDSDEIISYFNEVTLGAEYGDTESVIRKWNTDVLISTKGEWPTHLRLELTRIIDELNGVSYNQDRNFLIKLLIDPNPSSRALPI